jgi:hypothetical protein
LIVFSLVKQMVKAEDRWIVSNSMATSTKLYSKLWYAEAAGHMQFHFKPVISFLSNKPWLQDYQQLSLSFNSLTMWVKTIGFLT